MNPNPAGSPREIIGRAERPGHDWRAGQFIRLGIPRPLAGAVTRSTSRVMARARCHGATAFRRQANAVP
jgi:hypothetical protein